MKQPQDSGAVPEEAVKAALLSWEVESDAITSDEAMHDAVEAAAPAIRAQERERIREDLRKALVDELGVALSKDDSAMPVIRVLNRLLSR